MQQEILQLYEQKEKVAPGPEVKEFIEGLSVRDVARIWSMMGEGEDFIEALKRVLAQKISKVSGVKLNSSKHLNLEEMVKQLKEEKSKQEQEAEQAKEKAALAAKEREEVAQRMKREAEAAEAARREQEEAAKKEEEERRNAEERAKEKLEAEKAHKEAEERSRAAAEEAQKAAEAGRKEAEAAAEAARKELEELRKRADEAEKARAEAEARAEKERAELTRKEALRQAAEERAEEQKRENERLEREREEAERRAAELEAERKREEEHEEEECKEETLTVVLEAPDEPLGLDCLAGAGRVRIIDVSGACQRAGVKSASVLLKIDGEAVDSQDTLVGAVQKLRAAGKTQFDVVLQPPMLVSDEDKEIVRKFNETKEEIKKWKEMVEECQNVRVEMKVLQGIGLLDKGSTKPFCEVKLRECRQEGGEWKVGTSHKNPQKGVTQPVNCQSNNKKLTNAVWDKLFVFDTPKTDCIRVSIFGQRTLKKDYLGRVDLILPELLDELCVGPYIARMPIQGEEGRGPVGGELELALNLVSCDGRDDPNGA